MQTLETLGDRLNRLSIWKFAFLLMFVITVKTGIAPIGSDFVGWLRETARNYPHPTMYLVSSPLPLMLMRLLQYPPDSVWWGFGVIFYLVWIIGTSWLLIKKFPNHEKLAVMGFLSCTPVVTSLTMLGHIDIYTLIGASIAGLGTFRGHILLGAIFAAGGNSDQAIATTLCLFLLVLGGSKLAKKILPYWFFISLISYGALHLFVKVTAGNDPKSIIINQLHDVIPTSLASWHFLLYSILGLVWIPWICYVLPSLKNKRSKIYYVSSIIILPFAMSFFILDGTRVGTTVSFLVLLISFIEPQKENRQQSQLPSKWFGLGFLLIVVVPSVIVDIGGVLRLPLLKFLQQFGVI
jgi:hypothetical protein